MPGVANHCNNGETALGVTMRAQNGGTHLCVPCQRDRGWCDDRERKRDRERGREGEGSSHVPKTGNGSSTRRNARGKVSPVKFFSPATFSTAMNMQAKVVVTTSHPLTREQSWKWSVYALRTSPSKIIRISEPRYRLGDDIKFFHTLHLHFKYDNALQWRG